MSDKIIYRAEKCSYNDTYNVAEIVVGENKKYVNTCLTKKEAQKIARSKNQ